MSIPLLSNGSSGTLTETGFLSAKAQRIADLIHEFDETLILQGIPERQRAVTDTKPYRIVQIHPDYDPYVVMNLAEDELDHRVLATLFNAREAANGDVSIATQLENMEAAAEIMRLKSRNDLRDEMKDKAMFLIKTPFHTPTMDGRKFRL